MNWAVVLNADSDAMIFGWTDILLFDLQMLWVHSSCTCLSLVRHVPLSVKQQELNDLVVSSYSIALDEDDLLNVKVRLRGIVNKYDVIKVRVQHTLDDIFREAVKQPTKMGKLIIFS